MLKTLTRISVLIIIVLTACKKQKNTDNSLKELTTITDWKTVDIQQLPFEFSYNYDSIIDYYYTLSYFSERKLIDNDAYLNQYFSDSTSFLPNENLFITESTNYPYIGKGFFFKRLPDVNKHKVLIFIYQNLQEEETLPYFELQIFNENNDLVDKIIIVGGINYDCSWDRKFNIDTNYKLTVIDKEACYDIEDEKEIGKRIINTQYQIKENGSIDILNSKDIL